MSNAPNRNKIGRFASFRCLLTPVGTSLSMARNALISATQPAASTRPETDKKKPPHFGTEGGGSQI